MTTESKSIYPQWYSFTNRLPKLDCVLAFLRANGVKPERILMNSEIRVYPDVLVVDYVRQDAEGKVIRRPGPDGEPEVVQDERSFPVTHVPEEFGITWNARGNCQITPDTVGS